MFRPDVNTQKYGPGTLVSAGNQGRWLIIATDPTSRYEVSALNLNTFVVEPHSVHVRDQSRWMSRAEFDELFAFNNFTFTDYELTTFTDYDMILSKYAAA